MSLLGIEYGGGDTQGSGEGLRLGRAYRNAWDTLKQEHDSGVDSLEIISRLTRLMDEVVQFARSHARKELLDLGMKEDESLALLALGSYGRKELSPHSDVDLLFLVPEKITDWTRAFTEKFLYLLWDVGLDVGYSTRTVQDCVTLAQENFDVLTSILDARFLYGDASFVDNFRKVFSRKVLERVGGDFVREKLDGMEQRLEKHGGTVYVLEPNIKEGMGGLRDIHTALWVAKVLFQVESLEELARSPELDILDPDDYRFLEKSLNFLLRIRCDLHFASSAARDILTLDRQAVIAERFGVRPRGDVPAVEVFMQNYFRHTGRVHHITVGIIKRSIERRKKIPRFLARLRERDLGEGFIARDGSLSARGKIPGFFRENPARMMTLFRQFQKSNLELAPEMSLGVRKSLSLVDESFRLDPETRKIFFSILEDDRRLYDTLLLMNELTFLGSYIPEFATIHCKMQYDYYHTYTVDEHSIRAIKEIVDLPGTKSPMMQLYQKVLEEVRDERILLLVTILLHDVGKGKGSNHSEKGAQMVVKSGERLGFSAEQVEKMEFLVRNHLLLSHVAQRRDLHEEKTILQTARAVGDAGKLKLLFLLTMADLKAVGPGVWNEWKASLISELFLEALRVIEQGGVSREEILEKILLARAFVEERLAPDYGLPEIRRELDSFPERAFHVYTPGILAHLIGIRLKMGESPVGLSWRQARDGGSTNLFIVTRDFPGLFSRIAGVLAANNVNILGARILTTADGWVFDVLHVTDSVLRPVHDRMKYRIVNRELEKVVTGELDVEDLFRTRELSLPLVRREMARAKAPVRVEIDTNASEDHTVIDVYAADRIGLLYRITSTLADLGLSIQTAKVSTKVDQAVDVFYVKDLKGNKVTDQEKLGQVRHSLQEALAETSL